MEENKISDYKFEIDMESEEFKSECRKYERNAKEITACSKVSGFVAFLHTCADNPQGSTVVQNLVEAAKKQADLSKGYRSIKVNESNYVIDKNIVYTQHDIEQLEHEKELLLSEIRYIDKQIRQIKKTWKH